MRTVYLPGDAPSAQLPLPLVTVPERVANGRKSPPRPGARKGAAWVAAYTGMSSIAERMRPNRCPALRSADPVAHADLVTSMCDQRAALCLAIGVDIKHVDRNGYNTTRSASREGVTR